MNAHVTTGAVLVGGIGQVMKAGRADHRVRLTSELARAVVTFQAKRKGHRTFQHACVRRSMRGMAGLATAHANRGVFVEERPAFIGMTRHAGLFISQRLSNHARPCGHIPGRGERSMRVVAIDALHGAFVHAMLKRHRELGAHRSVATIAKLGLLLGQEFGGRRRGMHRMAVRTHHIIQRVFAAADVGARHLLGVAIQAGVEDPRRFHHGKSIGDRGSSATGTQMIAARAVAGLASGFLRRGVAQQLVVRIAVEVRVDLIVAGAADIAADKVVVGVRRRLRRCRKRQSGPQGKHEADMEDRMGLRCPKPRQQISVAAHRKTQLPDRPLKAPHGATITQVRSHENVCAAWDSDSGMPDLVAALTRLAAREKGKKGQKETGCIVCDEPAFDSLFPCPSPGQGLFSLPGRPSE